MGPSASKQGAPPLTVSLQNCGDDLLVNALEHGLQHVHCILYTDFLRLQRMEGGGERGRRDEGGMAGEREKKNKG
jgi:hypothetical protein